MMIIKHMYVIYNIHKNRKSHVALNRNNICILRIKSLKLNSIYVDKNIKVGYNLIKIIDIRKFITYLTGNCLNLLM